jgi:NitT/TauT family transport system substrate-binding protein
MLSGMDQRMTALERFPMFFASSALYPLWRVQEGSPWLATVCRLNPFTYSVELIRFPFYEQVNWLALGVMAGVSRRSGDRLRSGARHADAPGWVMRGHQGMPMIKRVLVVALAVAASACLAPGAEAADRLRVAIQKTGTASWEIEVIKARGLDKAANLDIETTELASTDAGKIALEGGAADMVVEDWLWAARERALGDKLLFTPYSSALGAVMAPKDSPVHAVADLAGRSIGVAGGPLDKSWLLWRAAALGAGRDLTKEARPSYGAPPLIAEKLVQGETETALEFWNFSTDLESRGFRRAIEIADVEKALGASGPVAMIGYVFSEAFAASHKDALKRYFAAAAEARKILAEDPSAWAPIEARLRLKDDAALAVYRQRYLEGVPKRTVTEEAADARILYHRLAEVGGQELVGKAKELDAGLFYDPATSE